MDKVRKSHRYSASNKIDAQSGLSLNNKCQVLNGNHDICRKCDNTVANGDKALQCESCLSWCHCKCISMSDQDYKIAMKLKFLKFICPMCEDDFEKNMFSNEETQKDTGTKENNDDLKKQLSQLTDMLHNVLDRLTKMEESREGQNKILDRRIEEMVDAKLQDALEDQRVKESKKLNLILVNVRESACTNIMDAKEEDKRVTEALIKEIFPEENIEVHDPLRLRGKQIGNRPRLLRVRVQDEQTKWNIIKNAHKLNTNGKRQQRVYINPDQTIKEREEYRRLKVELDRRTSEGEPHLKIERIGNKRQIVRRAPQDDEMGATGNSQGSR